MRGQTISDYALNCIKSTSQNLKYLSNYTLTCKSSHMSVYEI